MRDLGLKESLTDSGHGVAESLHLAWLQIKNPILVPLLRISVYVCAVMSIMLFIDRVYMAIVILCVKVLKLKSYTRYNIRQMQADLKRNNNFPRVLVQVPMYNEKEVYKLSIGAACRLDWPSDKIIIQILDDSTDPSIKELVWTECQRYANQGINIKYEVRPNRNGYKGGALKEGLKKQYVKVCDYIAIFDADFQPEPDFLWRSIPYFLHDDELGLVQARWKFANANSCIMTKIQEMSLNYHFSVEQEVGSSTYSFFGFNGTAGVWRLKALYDAGGWKDRTTVEDMDLAVRASLRGWKFVFIGDLSVKSELPSTYRAYRFQQHRWSCGPANLFRKMFTEILRSERVTLRKKLYVVYEFFFVRKIIAHFVTFFFYCVTIPACALVPDEIRLHKFIAVYIPATITILNAVTTPRSFHLLVCWILFENVMSMNRTKATIIGLLETQRVNEWIVTEKLGNTKQQETGSSRFKIPHFRFRLGDNIHIPEIVMGVFLIYCTIFDVFFGRDWMWIYLLFQAGAFFWMGIGKVGIQVPS